MEMTDEKKVDMLRAMMDGDETDEGILQVYLELAAQKILNRMYPFKEDYEGLDVPDRYAAIQLKIANYMINKIGAEGQTIHNENGVQRHFESSWISEQLLQEVVPIAGVVR